jgi:hypothetical protein
MKTTTYKTVKFNFGLETNQVYSKTYNSKEAAINAGNSWVRDCTVDQNIRKGRSFEIVELINN